jgi:hypothetical protein
MTWNCLLTEEEFAGRQLDSFTKLSRLGGFRGKRSITSATKNEKGRMKPQSGTALRNAIDTSKPCENGEIS